jgi:hypothetical protein
LFFLAFSSWVFGKRGGEAREREREREREQKGKTKEEKMHAVHICLRSQKSALRMMSNKSVTRR